MIKKYNKTCNFLCRRYLAIYNFPDEIKTPKSMDQRGKSKESPENSELDFFVGFYFFAFFWNFYVFFLFFMFFFCFFICFLNYSN